jgi:uncharacterized membrane protein YfcA
MVRYAGLIFLGFGIGTLSGFFGVGGGFLLVPLLNILFDIPYNIAVGSSLCQMIGTSIAASLKHRRQGNIDIKLSLFILSGSIGGSEIGARILMLLKGAGVQQIHGVAVDRMYLWINIIYVCLLLAIGSMMFTESMMARKRPPRGGIVDTDISSFFRKIPLRPVLPFPVSRIEAVSVWPVLVLGFGMGILSGLLGIGGGFVMTPAMIYIIGVPTHVAVGSGLFQIIFVSAYGTGSHFFKGNVDFLIVGCTLVGSLLASPIGAGLNKKIRGANIRFFFSWIVFVSIALLIVKFLFVIEVI